MKRLLLVPVLALSLGACSFLMPAAVIGTVGAVGVAAGVDKADPALGIGAKEAALNATIVAAVTPSANKVVHALWCNPYAQRAYDASEVAHQPACTAGQ